MTLPRVMDEADIVAALGFTPGTGPGSGGLSASLLGTTGFQSAGALAPRTLAARFADALNVKDFGAIGDGNAHPLSGVATFNGVSTVGWTLTQWQAIFSFATALTNNLDGLAIQAAINAAHALATGGCVIAPFARYVLNTPLTNPGVSNTNSNPPTPEVEIFGNGMLPTVFSWPADMGAGTFALASADRSTASYSRLKLRDIALVGPGCGSTYGASSTLMGGVGASADWVLERCWVSGFYYGVAIRQDHQKLIDCTICNNYDNVYFQGAPAGQTDNYGNQYFRGCALGGALNASVAVAWNTMISAAVFDCTEVGFAPYGFYREAAPSGSTVTLPFLADCTFLPGFAESCGNAVIYGENAADLITGCEFHNFIPGMTNAGYAIAGRSVKAAIYAGSLMFSNFYGGELTGGTVNNYSLVADAVIEMQAAIQSNFFGNAFNLVSQSTASKPALKAPTVLFNTYDTAQSRGRFLVAQASLAVGVPVSEAGFDEAGVWSAGLQFAGIAMAPATAGVVVPVSDQGVVTAAKSSGLSINQNDPITPVAGGVTNAGPFSGAAGIAWEAAAAGTTTVIVYLPRNGAGSVSQETARAEAAEATKLPLAGGTMTGALILSGAPTSALQAATKAYVDASTGGSGALPLAGGTMTGALTLSGAPTAALQAATKAYVDAETTRAEAAEGTLTTAVASETTRATGAESTLTTNLSAEVTRAEAAEATKLALAGGTMTGALTLAAAPTAALQAATKAYVDAETTRAEAAEATLTTSAATAQTTANTAVASVVSTSSATLTVTQPVAHQVYQRLTTTGGAYSLGAGFIPITISLSAAVVKVEVQLRDAVAGGNPVLVAYTQITGNLPAGVQQIQAPAPARLGWYFVDVRINGTTAVLGTSPVGMGHVVAIAGQSLAGAFVQPVFNDYSTTLASLGLTVNANASVDVGVYNFSTGTFNDNTSPYFAPFVAIPADNGSYLPYYGAGFVEYANRLVTLLGVNVGMIGHTVGASSKAMWQPGTPNNLQLKQTIAAAGGVIGTFIWWQGQGDSTAGTSQTNDTYALTTILRDIQQSFPALAFGIVLSSIGSMTTGSQGTGVQINAIRASCKAVATAFGAQLCDLVDAVVYVDGIHCTQAGSIYNGDHLFRATAKTLGLNTNGDRGPVIASVTRSGAVLTINFSQQSGGTALVGVGNWWTKFVSFNTGTQTAPGTATAGTIVSATQVTITLSAAPTGAQDVFYGWTPMVAAAIGSTFGLYDNVTPDAITRGSEVQVNTAAVTSN